MLPRMTIKDMITKKKLTKEEKEEFEVIFNKANL